MASRVAWRGFAHLGRLRLWKELSVSDSFVHLHCHSEFSMLDGAARIGDLFDGCAEMGMPAIAMTDHGNVFGAYEFWSKARGTGVKPIIGLEAYLTPGTHRSERKRVNFGDGTGDDVAAKGAYTHMTMWAENTAGMHNLFRLSSLSYIDGFFYKPRADRELLERYGKGLLATTGCPSGEVQTYLRLGKYAEARQSAAEFRDIFGKGNFFVELMDHGLDIERRVRDGLLDIAKDLDLPLVATNDLHYVHRNDAEAHDNLLCVSAGARKMDEKRFRFNGDGYYLKSPEEMRQLFSNLPEACDNTLAIAERCDVEFTEGEGRFMPRYPCPPGENEESWFVKEVEKGLQERFPEGVPEYAHKQAQYETEVIIGKGYPGYFLVVSDFIRWAKSEGIMVGPGRGSGAGSMCAYAMKITDLDPVPHGLIFERFLNPERKSMPDFDVDFDDRRRPEVIKYVTEKYGSDKVSMIVTYGTIKAKQAIKDSARLLDKPFSMGDMITKAMPPAVMGKDVPLKDLFDSEHKRYAEGQEFRELVESDAEVKQVYETGLGIEGLKRQWGVHAAGVIMSSEPLLDIIPLLKRESDGAIITQFDYPTCETLGLVKMDFLGLRNLTILADALANIKQNRGIDIDLDELARDLSDPEPYKLLARGDTLGVFQLDGGGMRELLRLMQPDHFEDISAALALYRPGPMGANSHTNYALRKNGRQEITPIHPELEEPLKDILGTTYGLIIYQEQVMAIAQQLAGYTLGNADLLRRAMGKKKREVLEKEFVNFKSGMLDNGFSAEAVQALWDVLLPFSDYAFNKAHTAAYGVVSYWTAYLKAHYPTEYMAALLTSVKDDKDKMATYLAECRHMGIKVLPPDVNESELNFTPVGGDIRFGLSAIRNVGAAVVTQMIAARSETEPATSFNDYLDKAPLSACNKRLTESLIKAGAFDSMGHTRRGLMEIYESNIDQVIDAKRNAANGQDDLFADLMGDASAPGSLTLLTAVPDVPDWDKRTKLAFEREMLGLYVSDHPLQGLEHVLEAERDVSIGRLVGEDGPRESSVTLCGMITQMVRKTTKKGDPMAIVTVEDLEASVEVLLFPKVYQLVSTAIATDTVVKIRGQVKSRDDSVSVFAQEVTVPDVTAEGVARPVVITVPKERITEPVIEGLKSVLENHPGVTDVHLRVMNQRHAELWRVGQNMRVTSSSALSADLKALLGPSCLSA